MALTHRLTFLVKPQFLLMTGLQLVLLYGQLLYQQKTKGANNVVVAISVIAQDALGLIQKEVDEVFFLVLLMSFMSHFYKLQMRKLSLC